MQRKRIGDLLIEAEILRPEELPIGLKEAERRSLRLGEVLVMLRYLSNEDLEKVLQAQSRLNEGTVRDNEAIEALRLAAKEELGFDDALARVRDEAADKKAQAEVEISVLTTRLYELEPRRGPHDKEIGLLCAQIADRYCDLDDYTQAEPFYTRALKVFERSYGARHLKVATVQAKLVEVLMQLERYKEAESKCWRVMDIVQDAWGDDHAQTAQANRALARALEGQYRLREAEQFYITALRITERVSGSNSPEATDLLRHLANFWRKQGKKPDHRKLGDLLIEAQLLTDEQLQAALAFAKQNACPLGQALVRMNCLSQEDLRPSLQAQILVGDGVLPTPIATRALKLGRQGRAFEVALRELGWEPDAFTTEELSLLLEAAEELMTAETALGSDHAGVAVLSMKLADIYTQQKHFAEAEPLYSRACQILEKDFGPRDPEVATALSKLARLYLSDNRAAQAEPLISRALVIRRAVQGDKHLDVAECTELLGSTYEKLGNLGEAEELYRTSLNVRKELQGADAERTLECEEKLASMLLKLDKIDEAEPMFRRLLSRRTSSSTAEDVSLAALYQHLGEIHLARKQYFEAENDFKRALEIYDRYDKSSLSAADLMEKMAGLLETTGRLDEAHAMQDRARSARRLRS